MKILWSKYAMERRKEIYYYIAEDNVDAADALDQLFIKNVDGLKLFPKIGRPGRKENTRELVIKNFILVYTILSDAIYILTVYHGARNHIPDF